MVQWYNSLDYVRRAKILYIHLLWITFKPLTVLTFARLRIPFSISEENPEGNRIAPIPTENS